MAKYFLACRIGPKLLSTAPALGELGQRIQHKLQHLAPWATIESYYALLGPYDLLYLLEAPDNAAAMKVAMIVRSLGIAHSEIWPAIEATAFEALAGEFAAHSQEYERKLEEALEESFPASDAPAWTGVRI
ncbi:hypothetical protein JCM13664_16820 [Methylothermus subterraneus]